MKSPSELKEQLRGVENPVSLLEAIFSRAPLGIRVFNPERQTVLMNEAYRSLFKVGKKRNPPRVDAVLNLQLDLAFDGQTIQRPAEWIKIGKHVGAARAVSSTFFPLSSRKNAVDFVAVIYKDDTEEMSAVRRAELRGRRLAKETLERGQQESALRASEERFAKVFHSSPLAVGISEGGRIVDANVACAALFGRTREEMIGKRVTDLGLWVDLSERARVMERLAAGEQIRAEVFRFRRKDGEIRHLETSFVLMPNERRPDPLLIVMHVDLTERIKAEQALAQSERNFRQIAETIREVFWVSSPDSNKVDYVSPAYETIWGRPCANLYVSPGEWVEAIHPLDRERIRQQLYSKANGEYEAEYRIVRPDGSVRWIRDHGFPIRDERGKIEKMTGIALDITEQKMLSQQLHQAQKMEAIGRLAGGVAHDFNNMLTAIIGYSHIIKLSLPENDERQADLKEIHLTAARAAGLTRQLLAFSRQQVMEPQVASLNSILDEMRSMMERLIGEDITIEQSFDADLGLVSVDPGQLGQVVMNLMVNARDAMPTGGKISIETKNVTLDAPVVAHAGQIEPGAYVMVAISDTGTGIDPKHIPNLFEPFFTTKETGRGTGLGLSTAYGIVKQSGGSITVYSEPGSGATFKIYLPRVNEANATYAGMKPESTDTPRGSGLVLLVEDERAVRKLASRILVACGYTVVDAGSPDEALALVEREKTPFDLLITDVILPGMNGKELANRLQSSASALKVLYMSGYTDEAIAHKGLLDPGIHFLSKPFSAAGLAHKVKEVLS